MRNRHIMSNFIKILFTFLCATVLSALVITMIVKVTLLNGAFILYETRKVDYAAGIREEVAARIQDEGRASGLTPEVLKNAVPLIFIQNNVENYIKCIYSELPFQLSNQQLLNDSLQLTIEGYAEQQQIDLTPEVQQSVDKFKERAVEIAQEYIELPYLINFGNKAIRFKSTLNLILVMLLVTLLLLMLIMLKIKVTARHIRIRNFSYIFLASGLTLTAFPLYFYLSGKIERLGLTSKIMYQFVTDYLKTFLAIFIGIGGIFCIIAVIIWLFSEKMRRRIVRKK